MKRIATCALLALLACASSCSSHAGLHDVAVASLTSADSVIAVRLSNASVLSGGVPRPSRGYTAFLAEDGTGSIASTGGIRGSIVQWTSAGAFFASAADEYVSTDSGTTRTPRDARQQYEIGRYPLSNGGTAAFYVDSANQPLYTVAPDGSSTRTNNIGLFQNNGQCGDRIMSLTETQHSTDLEASAAEAYASAHPFDPMPDSFDLLVELSGHDGDLPTVVGVSQRDETLESGQQMFACDGSSVVIPTLARTHPDASRENGLDPADGRLILQSWDLSTGTRTITPVTTSEGDSLDLSRSREVHLSQGILVGREYRFVSARGDVYTVNIDTAVGRYVGSIGTQQGEERTVFQVTERGVYALTTSPQDLRVTLTRHPWDGGQEQTVLSTADLAPYLAGNLLTDSLSIDSFALRPGWG